MTDAEEEAGEIVREIMDTLRDPTKTMDPVQFRSRIMRFAIEYGPEIRDQENRRGLHGFEPRNLCAPDTA